MVVIGYHPSGMDISRDIAGVAKEVHVAIRSAPCEMQSSTAHANLWLHPMVISWSYYVAPATSLFLTVMLNFMSDTINSFILLLTVWKIWD